jgi:hypothetical protein
MAVETTRVEGQDSSQAEVPLDTLAVVSEPSLLPVVQVQEKKKKKRKPRYSRGTKDLQRLERGMTRATHRIARAVAKGLDTYDSESRKSARRRRDGAMREAFENMALAWGDAAAEAAKAPYEIARKVNGKLVWRRTRAAGRVVAPLLFR